MEISFKKLIVKPTEYLIRFYNFCCWKGALQGQKQHDKFWWVRTNDVSNRIYYWQNVAVHNSYKLELIGFACLYGAWLFVVSIAKNLNGSLLCAN